MKTRARRSGFTLPEVLVTVTVVAVLAAVVVPAVVQQVSKGDQGQLANDLKAVQSAVGNFATDTRLFPRFFRQTRNAISTTDSTVEVSGQRVYTATEVGRWKGPYGGVATDSIVSGFGFVFGASAANSDTLTIASGELLLSAHGPTFFPGTGKFSYRLPTIAKIDSLVDGASGATAGSIRWTASGTTATDSVQNIKIFIANVH